MSMQPQSIPPVPPDTETVARAAFPKGNIYVLLRDNLCSIYSDVDFTTLFSQRGQPAESPWRLALISVMQFIENLSDRQAAEAVRSRIDWLALISVMQFIENLSDRQAAEAVRSRIDWLALISVMQFIENLSD